MAPSADRRLGVAAALLVLPLAAGCDSTFQQNARAKVAAARRLAAQQPQQVTQRGADVRVDRVTLLRDAASTAVVVDLHSRAGTVLADVPISVGVRRGAKKVLLNGAADLDWFQTHLPAVAAGGKITWVFRSPPGGLAKAGDVPFVRVGEPAAGLAKAPKALPTITASVTGLEGSTAKVALSAATVPQLGLPVTVVARRGATPVAAGTTIVDALERDQKLTVDVPLTGRAGTAKPSAIVTPTIFE